MRAVLLPASPPPTDPATPSLLAAARERLPAGWEPVPAPSPASAWRRLPNAAAVAFLGSEGVLGPRRGRLAEALALTLASQARAQRVALVGVRAAPARAGLSRLLVRALVARADLLVLADEDSAQALVAAGVPAPLRVGSDPVWAALAGRAPAVERRDVAIAAIGPGCSARKLVGLLRQLAVAGLEVALQPWERCPGEATRRTRAIGGELGPRPELLEPVADLEAARRRFAGARLAIAGPPHALIAAAAAETPVLAYGGAGPARVARSLARLVDTDGARPRTVAVLEAATPSRATVEAEVAAAEEGFRLLRLLLSDGEEGAEELSGSTRLAPEAWNL